ncbi:hypothetical protein M4D55_23390 [Metabacillus idriensis]|uniref:hypothetical protein n=1 Tax=Metabacillus idriensis TaxID=324768 RepID=UPI00204191E1|nr:hypothetical protein [Metabacillus idriensis]MCM3598707.1 hypothetical protein [Metabacillus idriensis]
MFEFKDLIDKYSVTFQIKYPSAAGGKETGDYDLLGNKIKVAGPTSLSIETGALIPLPARTIYQSGGRLTEADRMLYSTNHNIPIKSRILYEDLAYHVESKTPFEDFADFSQYTCKAVSSFD